jgi:hypothetical protein
LSVEVINSIIAPRNELDRPHRLRLTTVRQWIGLPSTVTGAYNHAVIQNHPSSGQFSNWQRDRLSEPNSEPVSLCSNSPCELCSDSLEVRHRLRCDEADCGPDRGRLDYLDCPRPDSCACLLRHDERALKRGTLTASSFVTAISTPRRPAP